MAKIHCTYTCIKSSKDYACCVWQRNKSTQVSHIMIIWNMRTYNILTLNHNCLMGTITVKVHLITPTSPKNKLATILKVFWFFLLLFFFAYFSFKHNMHGHIREKRNTQLCKPKHQNFAMLKHTNVIHDWWALVVRWLLKPFS